MFRILHAAPGRDDQTAVNKDVRYGHGRLQNATRVVAQVDNQAFKIAFILELDDSLFNFVPGPALELRDTEVSEPVFQISLPNTGHLDDFPCQCQGCRCWVVSFDQRNFYFASRLAAHGLDSVRKAHAFNRGVIKLDDQVTTFNAGFGCRRVVHG